MPRGLTPIRAVAGALALLAAAAAIVIASRGGGTERGAPVAAEALPRLAAAADARRGRGRFDPGRRSGPPNLIVLMVDDGALVDFERGLPRTRELLGTGGTEFTDAIVSTPLCCPSRATFLSGRYAHNHGILRNDPGYPLLDGKRDVLPVWLQGAGYRTAVVGKFMNGIDRAPRGDRAPGWDEWIVMERGYRYFDYELTVNDRRLAYGEQAGDYLTDVLTGHGLEVIERAARREERLFMWMSWWAPHPENSESTGGPCRGSAIPPERDPARVGGERLRAVPSVAEADVRDKPAFLRRKQAVRPRERRRARTSLRCRIASLEAVDRGVEAIVAKLEQLGELDDTVLLFTSDNGFFHLEHRLADGKGLPHEEAIRVPLLIDAPARFGRQPARVPTQVSNIDLAPTILELAGAEPCRGGGGRRCSTLDGESLVPLLAPEPPRRLRERALLVESGDGRPCPFSAVRVPGRKYSEYERVAGEEHCPGDRELYDLERDPDEVDNLLHRSTRAPARGEPATLRRLLRRIRACAGTAAARVPARPPCS